MLLRTVDLIGRELSHFRIVAEIGAGGMGIVDRGVDVQLGRPVAIKVLPALALADPDRRERFVREARAASALNHPNIVTVHEIGADAGVDFIVMELLEGEPLQCRDSGRAARRPGVLGQADASMARARWRPRTTRASSTATSSPRTSS